MPRTKERTAQIFSAPPALGAKLCAHRDLSALFWRLLPQAFWFCHPAQKQQRRAFLQSLRGSVASAFAPPPPPPPADSADSAPVQDGKQKTLLFFATMISVLGQNYKKAACGHWAMHHASHKVCPRRGRFAKHHVVLIFLRLAPTPELVQVERRASNRTQCNRCPERRSAPRRSSQSLPRLAQSCARNVT
jgi:hypothetical protein